MILSRYLKLIGLTFNLLTDFNEMIYVEVRDRLGIANIYVSCDINGTAPLEPANSIQSQSELHINGNLFTLNLIDVKNGSVKKLNVRWPIDIKLSNSNNVIYKPIYNMQVTNYICNLHATRYICMYLFQKFFEFSI